MKDDLLNYLIATDELDDFLGYEPICPICGNKLIKIIYDKMDDKRPKYHCNNCEISYFENLKDYIEEKNDLLEDEDE